MSIEDNKIKFIITIKNFFKLYNLFKSKFLNKLYARNYNFRNYNFAIVHSVDDIKKFKNKNKNKKLINKCTKINELALNGKTDGKMPGWCSCCNKKVNFIWRQMPKYSSNILFTETFSCPQCGMSNRIRAIIHLFKILEKSNPKGKKIYCHEFFTPFFQYLDLNYSKNNEIIGSEYFGANRKSGDYVNGVLHQDCLNLSFNDNEFDYIFSNDVFEHISDIDKALSESKRCLKSGGKLIFRTPVYWNKERTEKRAELINGEIIYLNQPVYHGGFSFDDPKGTLVFYDYGYNIFDILKNAGFSKTYGIAILDEKFVNVGMEPVVFFVCEK